MIDLEMIMTKPSQEEKLVAGDVVAFPKTEKLDFKLPKEHRPKDFPVTLKDAKAPHRPILSNCEKVSESKTQNIVRLCDVRNLFEMKEPGLVETLDLSENAVVDFPEGMIRLDFSFDHKQGLFYKIEELSVPEESLEIVEQESPLIEVELQSLDPLSALRTVLPSLPRVKAVETQDTLTLHSEEPTKAILVGKILETLGFDKDEEVASENARNFFPVEKAKVWVLEVYREVSVPETVTDQVLMAEAEKFMDSPVKDFKALPLKFNVKQEVKGRTEGLTKSLLSAESTEGLEYSQPAAAVLDLRSPATKKLEAVMEERNSPLVEAQGQKPIVVHAETRTRVITFLKSELAEQTQGQKALKIEKAPVQAKQLEEDRAVITQSLKPLVPKPLVRISHQREDALPAVLNPRLEAPLRLDRLDRPLFKEDDLNIGMHVASDDMEYSPMITKKLTSLNPRFSSPDPISDALRRSQVEPAVEDEGSNLGRSGPVGEKELRYTGASHKDADESPSSDSRLGRQFQEAVGRVNLHQDAPAGRVLADSVKIPSYVEMAPQIMRQIERLRESGKPWTRITLALPDGGSLAMHLKLTHKEVEVRFSDEEGKNAGFRRELLGAWSQLRSNIAKSGIRLLDPQFVGSVKQSMSMVSSRNASMKEFA